MAVSRNDIIDTIIESGRTTMTSSEEGRIVAFDEQTPLMMYMGNQGVFDSFGLVAFIVELEQAVEQRFGARLSLADERAASQEIMPFTSVSALAAYIEQLLLEIDPCKKDK